MKKITGLKQEEDQKDGNLDRANELDLFFDRFSSETSSASSSPACSQTDLHPPLIYSFTVTSQRSHLPPQSWICCCSIIVSNHTRRCWEPFPLPAVCLWQSGEAGQTKQELDCWSTWCQTQSPESLCRWLCRCGVHQWWTRDWIQKTGGKLCGMVWESSSHLKCQQDKRRWLWILGRPGTSQTAFPSWRRGGGGGGV